VLAAVVEVERAGITWRAVDIAPSHNEPHTGGVNWRLSLNDNIANINSVVPVWNFAFGRKRNELCASRNCGCIFFAWFFFVDSIRHCETNNF
jgi:hypothetical protein